MRADGWNSDLLGLIRSLRAVTTSSAENFQHSGTSCSRASDETYTHDDHRLLFTTRRVSLLYSSVAQSQRMSHDSTPMTALAQISLELTPYMTLTSCLFDIPVNEGVIIRHWI